MSREIVRGAIGIDFGTSKTSIAYLDKGNTNEVAATFSTTVNIDLSDMDSGEYLQVYGAGCAARQGGCKGDRRGGPACNSIYRYNRGCLFPACILAGYYG